ncbi:MAG TPA: hypothetical protein VFU88_13370 [Ktedonobacterales bacterium]|nr:hypothetical protein [Ktedonobacterales bacterium]
MRAREGNQRRRGATRGLLALLVVAGVWLALLGAVLGGASHASATARSPMRALPPSPSIAPSLPPLGTATPTNTPGPPPTKTPAASPSPSGSPTATTQPTATTPPDNGGGGGGGGGGDVGPQPTKVVFSQPTAGAGSGSPLGGLSPTTFGSNGLLLATTSSCIVSLLGLIIAAIALTVLLRGGYGPFLRALLHGRRAGLARGQATASGGNGTAGAAGDARHFGFGPGESFGRTRDGFSGEPRPSRRSGFDYDQYDQRSPRQLGTSRSAGRTPPPPGRGSRSDW